MLSIGWKKSTKVTSFFCIKRQEIKSVTGYCHASARCSYDVFGTSLMSTNLTVKADIQDTGTKTWPIPISAQQTECCLVHKCQNPRKGQVRALNFIDHAISLKHKHRSGMHLSNPLSTKVITERDGVQSVFLHLIRPNGVFTKDCSGASN